MRGELKKWETVVLFAALGLASASVLVAVVASFFDLTGHAFYLTARTGLIMLGVGLVLCGIVAVPIVIDTFRR